jgi:flavin reductase (DIM6/NTAB) family NADH-FMN oxidoreductase RutF
VIVDPAASSIHDIERLLVGVILPRPIAFVSTLSLDGVANLAPFSFFTAVCPKPPVICFCNSIRTRDGSKKDTLRNVEATGEFVVNVVSEDFAQQMVACSGDYPPDVSEFDISGLTPIPSDLVNPTSEGIARADGVPIVTGSYSKYRARRGKPGDGRSAALSCGRQRDRARHGGSQ